MHARVDIYCIHFEAQKQPMQASGDVGLLNDIEKQQEQTAKQISRITGTGMRREGLFGKGKELR